MAELLKGLSIDLDLNTIKLDRGLKGLKDSLKTVNNEMKANMSAFDRSDRSVSKYETRLDGLNKKLDVQKAAAKEAKAEHEKMVSEFGAGSAEAEKAAREYNNQAAQLNNLERYIERTKDELIELKKEQAIANSNWTKAGDGLTNFGNKLGGISSKAKDVGGSLTKWITTPALGVVSAVGGITAAFGWGRLVGLDSAQAQLKGLGYEAEDVERISDNLVEALDGGMMTMAEATSAAATAMAAGVEEGDELARYIQILDSAVVGGTGSFAEMEQIFGRIVDQGKMTRGEFDMISQRMPGFSSAVQEAMGVSSEEMYEMLRNGEITTNEFLDIMEGFAGDMASEYANSWSGMVQNTKAYIGIIGENLLGGVFEKSKESIGQFIELLKSDAVMDWASQMGQKIGDTFTKIVDSVKTGIEWFMDLETWQQKLIGSIGGLAVAMGPLLVAFGTIGGVISKVAIGFGGFFKWIGKHKELAKFGKTAGSGASKVGLLSRVIGALTGPVGWIITGITTLGAAFVVAYKKSDTFRGIINGIRDAIVNAYEKVKEFLTTNESFLGFIDSIKNGFSTAKDLIQQAFGAAMDFVQDKIAQVKSFWDSNGAQILQAFQNVFNGIWGVVQPVLNWIVDAVVWAFPYIKDAIGTALNLALGIVKLIWGNIKGVINGALDVIMGLVKTFSSLFTGDWSGMWEGIKQVLSGAVQFIWNFIQLSFFGRILKGGIAFVKSFAGSLSTMWTNIKNIFSTVIKWIVEFVKNRFTSMQNTVSNLTTGIRDLLSRIWNFIWDGIIKPIIKSIVDFVKNRFTSMRDTTSNIFTGIRDTASRLWNAVKEKIWNPVKNVVKNVKDRFTTLKDNVSGIFSNMRDNVSEWVGKMVQSVKDMPGKMKDGLVQMAYKVKDGVKDLGQKMMDGIGGGVNGVIGGVNWVLGKLQVPKDKQLVEWDVPQLAHGTKSHKGGPAILNDGKGDNAGEELIINPDGTTGMYRGKNVLANLEKGAQVIPAKMTRQLLDSGIPAYAKGIFGSAWDDIKSGVTWTSDKISAGYNYAKDTTIEAGKKIGEWTGNVWDYVENPGKLLDIALEKVGVSIPDGVGAMIEMAKGAFTTVKDKAIDFVKEKLNMGGPDGVSGGPGLVGAAGNWRSQIQRAAAQMGETVSPAEINGILAQINRESGGNQSIVQSSAVWDVNTAAGNPARGLLQYIPQTFNAYKVKGHGNIYSGYDQLLAFFNNRTWRRDLPYGRRGWGPRGGRKYGTGGLVNEGLYHLGEEGYPEWIIPTAPNRRTEAMKLLALAGKEISGNKRPHQLPNVAGNNDRQYDYDRAEEISLLRQQVELLTQLVLSSQNIEAKPALTEGDIKRSYDKRDSRESAKHGIFTGRPGGAY